jgi:hypothetical protein
VLAFDQGGAAASHTRKEQYVSQNNSDTPQPRATGPTTPEGKARAAANSLKQGLTSRADIVDETEIKEYEELKAELLQKIEPSNVMEFIAFSDMLHAAWNKLRIRRMEDAYIARGPEALEKPEVRKALELLNRYHTRHERSYYKAQKTLQELQTTTAMRLTLPVETHPVFPALANAMKIHIAKRTGEKVWTAKDRETFRFAVAQHQAAQAQREPFAPPAGPANGK